MWPPGLDILGGCSWEIQLYFFCVSINTVIILKKIKHSPFIGEIVGYFKELHKRNCHSAYYSQT